MSALVSRIVVARGRGPARRLLEARREPRWVQAETLRLESDVSLAAAPNPTTLLRLAEVGVLSSESIIRGVFEGRLGVTAQNDADAKLLRELEQQCRPNPERVMRASDALGAAVAKAQVIPDVSRSRYDLLLEVAPDTQLDRLAQAVDRELSSLNPEYQTKRASARLGAPNPLRMKPGWSRRVQAADVARGSRDAQYKWPFVRHEWDELSRSEVAEDERGDSCR